MFLLQSVTVIQWSIIEFDSWTRGAFSSPEGWHFSPLQTWLNTIPKSLMDFVLIWRNHVHRWVTAENLELRPDFRDLWTFLQVDFDFINGKFQLLFNQILHCCYLLKDWFCVIFASGRETWDSWFVLQHQRSLGNRQKFASPHPKDRSRTVRWSLRGSLE